MKIEETILKCDASNINRYRSILLSIFISIGSYLFLFLIRFRISIRVNLFQRLLFNTIDERTKMFRGCVEIDVEKRIKEQSQRAVKKMWEREFNDYVKDRYRCLLALSGGPEGTFSNRSKRNSNGIVSLWLRIERERERRMKT